MNLRGTMCLCWLALSAMACAELPEDDATTLALQHPSAQALVVDTLQLGDPVYAELPGGSPNELVWTFRMEGPGTLRLRTQPAEAESSLDTVLILQRQSKRGFLPIARNDDAGGTRFSELSRALTAGDYRVVVAGFSRRVHGPFVLASRCEGTGCPPRPAQCLFGGTFGELRDSALFEAPTRERFTEEQAAQWGAPQSAQLLRAVQVAYEEANDVIAALHSVDQQEVYRYTLQERDGARVFVVYEYGAGDNSYGAVFEAEQATPVAEIHDGDLYECTVFGTPHGARPGAACGGVWGMTCDFGLSCSGFDPERGAGQCSATLRAVSEAASRGARELTLEKPDLCSRDAGRGVPRAQHVAARGRTASPSFVPRRPFLPEQVTCKLPAP